MISSVAMCVRGRSMVVRPRTVWKSFKAKYAGEEYLHANSSSRPHAVWNSSKAKTGIRTKICAKAQPSLAGIRRKQSRNANAPMGAPCVRGVVLIRWDKAQPESEPIFAPKRNRVLRVSGANVAEPARGACAAWFDLVGDSKNEKGWLLPSLFVFGGDNWNRTSDLLHVKQAL